MKNEIIVVEQLPVITQRLQTIKTEVTEKVNTALAMVCTEETIQCIKKSRAELNKEFAYWEDKRKEVKKAVLSPYEQFETVYKDCITTVFKNADAELKGKIDSVENELKLQKARAVIDYFNEYLCSAEIGTGTALFEFVTFEKANINVTLSASLKSLKEQAKAFIDRICDDLNLIDTQEHKDEIFYEYKQSLNVSNAITTVANRYKAIEEAKAREEERKAKEKAAKEAADKVDIVVETLTPPTVEPIAPPTVEEPILTLAFKVTATKSKLRALKEFLNNGGYKYE